MKILFTFFALTLCVSSFAQEKILMFVSQDSTYYSEYIVMKSALEKTGYVVDVFTASTNPASCYSATGDIEETADSCEGSSYNQFIERFEIMFGQTWNDNDNSTLNSIPVIGDINDLVNIDNYRAMVIAGGVGILKYRIDGTYEAQAGLTALQIENTAKKLNSLAVDALQKGKPVLAQCHGASLPLYWRVPNTSGPGVESLGYSLLKDGQATGYPSSETAYEILGFGVGYKALDKVVVTNPNSALQNSFNGKGKLITSKDWYPQSVSHAAKTLINILQTYPKHQNLQNKVKVLILHGGAVDPNNCSPSNKNNDIPCNYGIGINTPADYTDIQSLLNSTSYSDGFQFEVYDVNMLSSTLPYDLNNQISIENYFMQFDALLFFKHWSNGISTSLQHAILNYVKSGKGLLALHHALYNDQFGKNILIDSIFKAQSSPNNWQGNLSNYELFNTSYGHFVSTYEVNYYNSNIEPKFLWNQEALLNTTNYTTPHYPTLLLYDELYFNLDFLGSASFGKNKKQIQTLFSNDHQPATQSHTAGIFTYLADSLKGRAVYLQVGERKENFSTNSYFSQVIRNASAWSADLNSLNPTTAITNFTSPQIIVYPNPTENTLQIQNVPLNSNIEILDLTGRIIKKLKYDGPIDISDIINGIYILKIEFANTKNYQFRFLKE